MGVLSKTDYKGLLIGLMHKHHLRLLPGRLGSRGWKDLSSIKASLTFSDEGTVCCHLMLSKMYPLWMVKERSAPAHQTVSPPPNTIPAPCSLSQIALSCVGNAEPLLHVAILKHLTDSFQLRTYWLKSISLSASHLSCIRHLYLLLTSFRWQDSGPKLPLDQTFKSHS